MSESSPPRRSLTARTLGRIAFELRSRAPTLDKRFPEWIRVLGFGALPSPPAYFEDGLCSIHDHGFTDDDRFRRAYDRGVKASQGVDHEIRWRAHVFLWVARQAAALPGDFVECGVNTGFLSSAMLADLEWNGLQKTLYLLDTFRGPVFEQYAPEEQATGRWEEAERAIKAQAYQTNVEAVRANFAEWARVVVVPGMVPETLGSVPAERIAFLHLDMNCSKPEIAALENFWPKITPGGFILSDDYAGRGFEVIRKEYQAASRRLGFTILSLPTGQGLIHKPAAHQSP